MLIYTVHQGAALSASPPMPNFGQAARDAKSRKGTAVPVFIADRSLSSCAQRHIPRKFPFRPFVTVSSFYWLGGRG
eukprot:4685786-Pleurochrysis_carterae.AAC.1